MLKLKQTKDGVEDGDTSSFITNGEWDLIGKLLYWWRYRLVVKASAWTN
jgi:hypothetical protein